MSSRPGRVEPRDLYDYRGCIIFSNSPRAANGSTKMCAQRHGCYIRVSFQAVVIAALACACASDPSSSEAVGGDMAEEAAVQAAPLGVPTSRAEVVRGRPVYALNSGGTI